MPHLSYDEVKWLRVHTYRNSFNVSATIFFYFSLFGDFQKFSKLNNFDMNEYFFMKPLYLKTPNIELPESEIKVGVASSRGLPRPLKCDYLWRVTTFQGRLILKELRYVKIEGMCDFD